MQILNAYIVGVGVCAYEGYKTDTARLLNGVNRHQFHAHWTTSVMQPSVVTFKVRRLMAALDTLRTLFLHQSYVESFSEEVYETTGIVL